MRVLSLIFFPFYVVMQVIIPLYFFSTFYNDKDWSLALAIVGGGVTALVVWAGYILFAVITRFFTSLYWARLVRAIFGQVVLWLTKKESPKWDERKQRLDSILTSIDIINASSKGEESPLDNILGAAPNRDHLKEGIESYMKDIKGDYDSTNIARLYLILYKHHHLVEDNIAKFYKELMAEYPEGNWVLENSVQRYVAKLDVKEGAEYKIQEQMYEKYFRQIKADHSKCKIDA